MQSNNLLEIRFSQSIKCPGVSHGYEIHRLGESVHDYPY